MNFITRAAAEDKVREHWSLAVEACRSVGAPTPWCDFTRSRNYEIEGFLEDLFGGEWCVSEWCPFNGWMISKWQDYCPRADLDEVLRAHRDEGYDRVVPLIEEKIRERFGPV